MPTIHACRACGNIAEHYDSIATHCKECWKARVRANRAANAEHYRAFDRERGKTAERKASYIEKQRRMRAANPNMLKAHSAVARAIKSGALVRPAACQRCPASVDVEAHHDDHAKAMEVMWLCPVCHAGRHRELRRLRAMAKAYGNDIPLPDRMAP